MPIAFMRFQGDGCANRFAAVLEDDSGRPEEITMLKSAPVVAAGALVAAAFATAVAAPSEITSLQCLATTE
jgi:hypothetical protein